MPTLNKKLIVNSISIIFDLLQKCNNKGLISEVSSYLMICIYNVFRILYSANARNPQGLFKIPSGSYEALSNASICLSEQNIKHAIKNQAKNKDEFCNSIKKMTLSPDVISNDYPLYASSLYNLLQTSENSITSKIR